MRKSTPPTRERILQAAKQLFQQRGYYAVGTAEILTEAKAPKGSMYHHFPDGKEQIAIAAVAEIRNDVITLMTSLEAKGLTVAATLRTLSKGMAAWLKASKYREGTMLASTTVGSVPDLPKLNAAIKAAFNEWHAHIARRLIAEGHTKTHAQSLAQTVIATMEGAMVLARIQQDERIVIQAADALVGLID